MLSSRKKSCYFQRNGIKEIDYKDQEIANLLQEKVTSSID